MIIDDNELKEILDKMINIVMKEIKSLELNND
jgi:hypothetical protein